MNGTQEIDFLSPGFTAWAGDFKVVVSFCHPEEVANGRVRRDAERSTRDERASQSDNVFIYLAERGRKQVRNNAHFVFRG